MPLLLFALLGLVLVQTAAFSLAYAERTHGQTEIQRHARQEAYLYRSFALAAMYALSREPFLSTTVQTRSWAQIRSSPHVPAHLRNIGMPATWRVRGTSYAWVICLNASEPAVMLFKTTIPDQDPAARAAWLNRIVQGSQTYWISGEINADQEALYATWCQS